MQIANQCVKAPTSYLCSTIYNMTTLMENGFKLVVR